MTTLIAIPVFLGVAVAIYWLGGRVGARGEDSAGKHLPYACGEDLGADEMSLSYRRFFWLGLMFVVVHMATLVVAMLPLALNARVLATAYLLGVMVCVDMLREG